MVQATSSNRYSDLFWALQGGGGQFGIVTTFYQEAAPEPALAEIEAYVVTTTPALTSLAQKNTVEWFKQNKDPFSLMYYATGVLPADPSAPATSPFGLRTLLIALRFQDPGNTQQASFNATFTPLFKGLTSTGVLKATVPYAELPGLFDPFYPYGFRRGFYGPQLTNVTTQYLQAVSEAFALYIEGIELNDESPATALWALQYMSPGLNDHLPASGADTAWPHPVAGHQTLFSPAWTKQSDDAATLKVNALFDGLTYAQQAINGKAIADYPNYISPGTPGNRVWGSNVPRLCAVKQKYDPQCRIHNGRVFASPGCIMAGFANIFP